jgi:hypothetical protein
LKNRKRRRKMFRFAYRNFIRQHGIPDERRGRIAFKWGYWSEDYKELWVMYIPVAD